MLYQFPEAELCDLVSSTLALATCRGANAAELSVSLNQGVSVTSRAGSVESIEHEQSQALQITVYCNHCTGTASTTDLSASAIETIVTKALSIATYSEADVHAGLADKSCLAFHYPDLALYHHWALTPIEAIAKTIECEKIALSLDKRLTKSEGVTLETFDSFAVYGNTLGFLGHYPESYHSLSCALIGETKHGMQRDYAHTSARDFNQLETLEAVAKRAAKNTLQRLDPRKLKTQRCPVLFVPRVAKSFWRHFISAISGSNLYRKTTFLADQLNQSVFPNHITLQQQPHIKGGMGSAPYDNDGVVTQDRAYVEQGELVSYVLGSYSARKLGMQTTGNAGGVFNLVVTHGGEDFEKLIKTMNKGLIVIELLGQGVNLVNGNYSRGACGLWVENGEIQYAVDEITIAGNLKDMFAHLVAVGSDVDNRGSIHTGSVLLEAMTVAGC